MPATHGPQAKVDCPWSEVAIFIQTEMVPQLLFFRGESITSTHDNACAFIKAMDE